MLYSLVRLTAYVLFKIFFRLEIKGVNNIPKTGGFILASNHASYLDPISLAAGTRRQLNFMARHDLFKGRFGKFISAVGAFQVKRGKPDLSAIKEAIRRVENGGGLLLFPEGERKFDSDSGEPQPGIGFLASKLEVPVIPAYVSGTDLAWPKGAKSIKFTKIKVMFGPQIIIKRGLPYQDIAMLIMDRIKLLS
ncbi:MAG: lysophospholipid acyltransferase family protein [Candidatus Omnitrophota bacterium]|jgi:1-acyl-sn-glycerol-3-phosphate acyltransferase